MTDEFLTEELLKEADGIKILCVEDDETFLKVLHRLLSTFFTQISLAHNGEEGLFKFESEGPFDIVLTDITMPKMDGLSMTSKIKEKNSDVYIIAISAHNETEKLLTAIDVGIDGFLTKPLNSDKLMIKLLQIIKQIKYASVKLQTQILSEQLAQRARQATMGEMISAIAHQLKQPLTTMGANLSMIELETDDLHQDKQKSINKELDMTRSQIEYIAKTIDIFANFLKPSIMESKVSIKQAVDNTLRIIGSRLKHANIKVDLNIDESAYLKVAECELAQVIVNILANMADAFEEKNIADKFVTIKCEVVNNNSVLLTIADNAGGIPQQVIDKIFEPYLTSKANGTGLGMYICKKIVVEKLKGTIVAQNELGGAKFTITAPLA